jgi:hypothetical protein
MYTTALQTIPGRDLRPNVSLAVLIAAKRRRIAALEAAGFAAAAERERAELATMEAGK